MQTNPQSGCEIKPCAICSAPCLPAGETFNGKWICQDCLDHITRNDIMKLIINSGESLARAISEIKELYHSKKYVRLDMRSGRDRSLDQNSLFHAWIGELVRKGGEFTADEYRNFCRLHFFVPILIEDNPDFKSLWFSLFPKENRDAQYELKLKLVGTITGITSICTTAQFTRALDDMQRHYATLPTDPVFLESEES